VAEEGAVVVGEEAVEANGWHTGGRTSMTDQKKEIEDAAWLRSLMREQVEDLRPLLQREVQQVTRDLRGSLERIVQPFQADTERLNRELAKAKQEWQDAQNQALLQKKRLLGMGTALLVLCLITLGATYEALYGYYQKHYEQLMGSTSYLEALNRSDVVPCGDGRLCAHIDAKAPAIGDKKQYRLVELKQ
jgi:hypothetical protein